MQKEDFWLLILVLALAAGIILTILFSENQSKHGYGASHEKDLFKKLVTVYT